MPSIALPHNREPHRSQIAIDGALLFVTDCRDSGNEIMKQFCISMLLLALSAIGCAAGIRADSAELVEMSGYLRSYTGEEDGPPSRVRAYKRAVRQLEQATRALHTAVVQDVIPGKLAQRFKDTAAIYYEVSMLANSLGLTIEGDKALHRYEHQFYKVGEKFTYYVSTPFSGYR